MLDLEQKYLQLAGVTIKRVYKNSLNFPCPVCGDSKTNKFKARGSLSKLDDGVVYHCFNCEFSGSFASLLGALDTTLKDAYLRETNKEKREQFLSRKNELDVFAKPTQMKLPSTTPNEVTINASTYKVTELTDEAKEYLLSRKLDEADFKHFKSLPAIHTIITFMRLGDEVIGFQTRTIRDKFYHITIEDGHDKCWNLDYVLKLPHGTTVYVFESVFNALSVSSNNVMAGLGSSLSQAVLEMLAPYNLVFCYDNDETGIRKTIQFTTKGYSAVVHHPNFVWGDYNDALKVVTKEQLQGYIDANTMSAKMANLKLRLKK